MTLQLPFISIAMLIGCCCTYIIHQLPPASWVILALILAIIMICNSYKIVTILGYVLFGFCISTYAANNVTSKEFPQEFEGKKLTIYGSVVSVIENSVTRNNQIKLIVSRVDNNNKWKLPAYVLLNTKVMDFKVGQYWSLDVRLKRPRGYANQGSFDLERNYFAKRISAKGFICDSESNRLLSFKTRIIPKFRSKISIFIKSSMQPEFNAIMQALLIGNNIGVAKDQSEIMQKTGTVHLLAISGLHLGLLANICYTIVSILMNSLLQKNRIISYKLNTITTIVLLIFYANLVGLGVATLRALLMIGVLSVTRINDQRLSIVHCYFLTLLMVLIYDPLVILSSGFWYSFIAVGFLIYTLGNKGAATYFIIRVQVVLLIAMLPLNYIFFQQFSIISVLSNIVAVPTITIIVLPLGILALVLKVIHINLSILLFACVHKTLQILFFVLKIFAKIPAYNFVLNPDTSLLVVIISFIGALWILAPRGLPGRFFGVFGFIPAFFAGINPIPYGGAQFTLLDVGQGLSAVIRTKSHILVYDTGAKINSDSDFGAMVVAPYLRSLGIKSIDKLIISHIDNDHIGGLDSVLRYFTTYSISSSELFPANNLYLCESGQSWEWDGVEFKILSPLVQTTYNKRNDKSCVLMVKTANHKLLLTGDIESYSENKLLQNYDDLSADVLLVPHHGSKSSSSLDFIQAVKPKYALFSTGYKNSYGHPKTEVLQRYQTHNIQTYNTALDGAIRIDMAADLSLFSFRTKYKHFWMSAS